MTMWLWNALIPGIIGWTSINYWQALGLMLLIRLLFGHFGPFGGFGHPRMSRREHRHLHEAMRGMSHSEKREFIRRRMRGLCERERPPMKPEKNNPAEVFENYRRQLRTFIARRVDSEAEGEDILQEVFMRFVQTDTVNPIGQVAAWLFRTARNRIIDHSRKRREERMPQMREQDDESGFVSEITALAGRTTAVRRRWSTCGPWSGRRSKRPSANCPAAQRDVFELTEMEGFTFRELAEDTRNPRGDPAVAQALCDKIPPQPAGGHLRGISHGLIRPYE